MKNPIKQFRERRQQKQRRRELQTLAGQFQTLAQLEKSGLLSFDVKSRRLFIEQPLALLMMVNAESWQNFMRNVFQWLYYRQCQEAWDQYIQREELKAVRRVAKKFAMMSRADVERVRRARREEIAFGDVEPPKVEPFEFFIVREVSPTSDAATAAPAGELVAVGHYDPETEQLEMALWEEVKPLLRQP